MNVYKHIITNLLKVGTSDMLDSLNQCLHFLRLLLNLSHGYANAAECCEDTFPRKVHFISAISMGPSVVLFKSPKSSKQKQEKRKSSSKNVCTIVCKN